MNKQVNGWLILFLILAISVLGILNYRLENNLSLNLSPPIIVTRPTATNTYPVAHVPAPPPVPTCIPGTIPAVIGTSMNLCGTIPVTTTSIIIANNVVVNCAPGTVLQFAPLTPASTYDALQISPGLSGVQIIGCVIQGKFTNAIRVMAGASNALIKNNILTGQAFAGIKEEYLAQGNNYNTNTISGTNYGMKLEGQTGNAINNIIKGNTFGIFTGIETSLVSSTTPGAICSSGINTNSFPPSPLPVICNIILSGLSYTLNSNAIFNSDKGIVTYGLDNKLLNNIVQSNRIGVEINAIYAGSEINPNIPPNSNNYVQEYFGSGAKITSNTITNNMETGVWLNGGSTYFWQTSVLYSRFTVIQGNIISNNGKPNNGYGDGIIIGRNDNLLPEYFYSWGEYTDINNNQLNNNLRDGIVLLRGNFMTDVRENTISNNLRNGISLGGTAQNVINNNYFDFASDRFIYHNKIDNNQLDGIHVYNGLLNYVFLNEIDNNLNRGIYVPEDPSGLNLQSTFSIICNDLSFNLKEGFNFDGKWSNHAGYMQTNPVGVFELKYNRVLNNGASGIRYYVDPGAILTNYVYPTRTINNLIKGNGFTPNPLYVNSGYGVEVDGFYYHGFFANNFIGNNLGPSYDSGSLSVENMWDEGQFEKAYDNLFCKCGNSCNYDSDCGTYSGTCSNGVCIPPPGSGLICNPATSTASCYANPSSLPYIVNPYTYYNYPSPYTPRGNFGLAGSSTSGTLIPFVVPPSAAPPLQPITCSSNQQCTTDSCEFYPAPISNSQCGNGDFIYEPNQFQGYYQPPFATASCPFVYYYLPNMGIFVNQPEAPDFSPPSEDKTNPLDLLSIIIHMIFPGEGYTSPQREQVEKDRANIIQQNAEN